MQHNILHIQTSYQYHNLAHVNLVLAMKQLDLCLMAGGMRLKKAPKVQETVVKSNKQDQEERAEEILA